MWDQRLQHSDLPGLRLQALCDGWWSPCEWPLSAQTPVLQASIGMLVYATAHTSALQLQVSVLYRMGHMQTDMLNICINC